MDTRTSWKKVTMLLRGSILLCFVPPGENKVSLDAAVKFVKLLFRYEQWDMFCILSDTLQHTVSHNTHLPGLASYNYVVSVTYTVD